MKILWTSKQNIAQDGTARCATSHLGLFCLPMSHKRDAGLNELTARATPKFGEIGGESRLSVDFCVFSYL